MNSWHTTSECDGVLIKNSVVAFSNKYSLHTIFVWLLGKEFHLLKLTQICKSCIRFRFLDKVLETYSPCTAEPGFIVFLKIM